MSIFDTLFGVSDAHVNAPQINATAGTRAIQQQSALQGQQLGSQQYAFAGGARGQNSALALREAQRRAAMGQQQIGANAVAQQSQLEQNVAAQNAQMQMQANQANANIEMQNDQAFSRGLGGLISTGATAAMFMSDIRAKENVRPMYSDFATKEAVSPLRPPPARITPERAEYAFPIPHRPDAESRAAFGLDRVQRPTNTLEQGAIERRVIEEMQHPETVSPIARYQPQMMRPGVQPEQLSNRAISAYLRDKREADELKVETARQAASPQYNPLLLSLREYGRGMMSDARAKEKAFSEGVRVGASRSPMTPGYGPPMRAPAMAPGYGFPRPGMVSDFGEKEMSADESRDALAPIDAVNYRYRPEAAARMAAETGETPEEQAMVYADKRAPRDGIIAQQLQQSPAFRPSVMQTPAGLAVDRDRALSTNLAATAGQAKVNAEQDAEIREDRKSVV